MAQYIKANKIFGINIRNSRKKLGLTQDQLAAHLQIIGCDISRGTLAKIEAGIRHITLEELKAIKFALSLTYSDILD